MLPLDEVKTMVNSPFRVLIKFRFSKYLQYNSTEYTYFSIVGMVVLRSISNLLLTAINAEASTTVRLKFDMSSLSISVFTV